MYPRAYRVATRRLPRRGEYRLAAVVETRDVFGAYQVRTLCRGEVRHLNGELVRLAEIYPIFDDRGLHLQAFRVLRGS